jgi:hypothetical protein
VCGGGGGGCYRRGSRVVVRGSVRAHREDGRGGGGGFGGVGVEVERGREEGVAGIAE